MSTIKKGQITASKEWRKHLRRFWKRRFWKAERKASARVLEQTT
jgi:hypothetical protein